ncbi:MAG: molybdopterin molybdotransferase MoeA [Acidimicrobiaceae bacterium]|nr:molybdopterin molybdotransferase MoeA [Acidimicrobiaceae bacterium]MCY4293409.1 molybdopterin molybdotransferase MoeA [Acidimicrobiaceae bacterium]
MIPLSEAREHVLSRVEPLTPRRVALDQVLGLVLAEPVHAHDSIPGFTNTAMDGYAVRACDTAGAPVELAVVGAIAAGDDGDLAIGAGQAARIMTGAPLPEGADAVVKVESTRRLDESADRVRVEESVEPGNHIRYPGEDVTAGERVLAAGLAVTPGRVGLLASVGAYEVAVHPRPRVGVLSTGDELLDSAVPLRRGQIRDTNRRILLSLVQQAGFEGVDLGIARDDPAEIERAFRAGAAGCDAVLSSGGVSMGDYDYVKVVLDRIGDMRWMQIAIKPAKPFAFGVVDGIPVLGLPGNPVSSMVSFELLAKPALRSMAGFADAEVGPNLVKAVCGDDIHHSDGKTHYVRCAARRDSSGVLHVSSAGGQGSHQLAAMTRADALAVIPDGAAVRRGDLVEAILLNTGI